MSKPQAFKHAFVALHSTPYIETDGARPHQPLPAGTLDRGQLVWAGHLHQCKPSLVTAFVDSVGIVSLDPRWLVPAELYSGLQARSH